MVQMILPVLIKHWKMDRQRWKKNQINQLAARQKKFIEQLEAALVRIENKTYGVCRETGKLIQKERLRAVPHTTLSMEAKLKQY